MGYRIASFNLRNIGKKALGKSDPRDLQKIAEIIKREEFDIVALQEILSGGQAFFPHKEFLKENGPIAKPSILMELGPDWDFRWADVSKNGLTSDQRKEGYAFLWNTTKFSLTSYTSEPYVYSRKEICEKMTRLPYYARFTPTKSPFFEIRLICIHTYYGTDSWADRDRRRQEVNTLLTEVYPRIATKIYAHSAPIGKPIWNRETAPKPAYTVLLGDYNMELWSEWKAAYDQTRRKPEYMERVCPVRLLDGNPIVTEQDEFTTLKCKEDESGKAEENMRGYAHDYDHFSYAKHLFRDVSVKSRRIDAVRKYFSDDFMKYRETISDHVPIVMELNL